MALSFPEHPDVVFRRAPLTQVLCQIRFSPILALMDQAGVAGFHEALRRDYPDFEADQQTDVLMSPSRAEVQAKAPVWRLRDDDRRWQVSLGIDFVALEVNNYGHFAEFIERLSKVISVLERTLSPGRSTRIGLRKINLLKHPQVNSPIGWRELLKGELLGLLGAQDLPDSFGQEYSELNLVDKDDGTLTIRHGTAPDNVAFYVLDLDYWTSTSMPVTRDDSLSILLQSYSDAMTGLFHWCLNESLYHHLEPIPRSEVAI